MGLKPDETLKIKGEGIEEKVNLFISANMIPPFTSTMFVPLKEITGRLLSTTALKIAEKHSVILWNSDVPEFHSLISFAIRLKEETRSYFPEHREEEETEEEYKIAKEKLGAAVTELFEAIEKCASDLVNNR